MISLNRFTNILSLKNLRAFTLMFSRRPVDSSFHRKKVMLPLVAFSITVAGCGNQMSEEELGRFYCEQWRKGEIASEFAYNIVVQGIVFNRGAYGKGFIDPKDY